VESQGCPHCAGREVVGWGRSDGLLRFRCKSCGRTFNALTKTPMAHLRKKERWLDHAQKIFGPRVPTLGSSFHALQRLRLEVGAGRVSIDGHQEIGFGEQRPEHVDDSVGPA
jgi:transposase-like protein